MNTREITEDGLLSVATFWKASIPLIIASVVVPVAFSGLLIRTALSTAVYIASPAVRLYYRLRDQITEGYINMSLAGLSTTIAI